MVYVPPVSADEPVDEAEEQPAVTRAAAGRTAPKARHRPAGRVLGLPPCGVKWLVNWFGGLVRPRPMGRFPGGVRAAFRLVAPGGGGAVGSLANRFDPASIRHCAGAHRHGDG